MNHAGIRRVEAAIERSRQVFPTIEELAGSQFAGNTFISHTVADHARVEREIVGGVSKAAGRCFFLLSRRLLESFGMGGAEFSYCALVSGALTSCKTIVICLSSQAAQSDWVAWECSTAMAQGHPIVVCALDETRPEVLDPQLAHYVAPGGKGAVVDMTGGGGQLADVLARPEFAVGPWQGRALAAPKFSGDDFLRRMHGKGHWWEREE